MLHVYCTSSALACLNTLIRFGRAFCPHTSANCESPQTSLRRQTTNMADESPATVTPGAIIATWIGFFIVSLAAGRMGILFPRYLSLPLITGYLVVGSIAGPFVLDIIHKEDLPRLSYVTQFALAFIAFSAGSEVGSRYACFPVIPTAMHCSLIGERIVSPGIMPHSNRFYNRFSHYTQLYLPELRSLFKRIMYQTSSIALVTFVTCTALIFSLGQLDGLVPFMSGLPMACQASVATIAAGERQQGARRR